MCYRYLALLALVLSAFCSHKAMAGDIYKASVSKPADAGKSSIFDESTQIEFMDGTKWMLRQPMRPLNGLGGQFPAEPGESKANTQTIKDALGADLEKIMVLWIAPSEGQPKFNLVVDAISDALQTSPRRLYRYLPWPNNVLPRFIAQPHFADGKSGWLELANGYVCFQDKQGTFWWTRFTSPSDINLAEVRGELEFKSGYIIHTADGKEIWLRMVEDKILVRQLQAMTGKSVIARGQLRRIPNNVTTSIPKGASYLDNGFTIELAP